MGHNQTFGRFLKTDSSFHSLLKNSNWVFLAGIILIIIGFAQNIILARALGVEKYGVLALILSLASTMGQLLDSRSWETSIKFVTKFLTLNDDIRALATIKLGYWIDFVTSVLSFVVLFVFADRLAEVFLSDPQYAYSIRLYAVTLLFNWNGGTQVLVKIYNRFDVLSALQIGVSIFQLTLVCVAWFVLELGINGILVAYIVSSFVRAFLNLFVAYHFIRVEFSISWRDASPRDLNGSWIEIVRFLFSTNLTQSFKIMQNSGMALMLGYFATPYDVGLFRLAQSYASKILVLFSPVFQSSYPHFAKIFEQGHFSEARNQLKKLILVLLAVGIPVLLIGVAVSESLIVLSVGPEYLEASASLRILFVAYAVAGSLIWIGPILLAGGRAEAQTISVAVGSLALFAAALVLIPRRQSVGAAWALVVFYFTWAATAVFWLKEILVGEAHRSSDIRREE